VSIKKLYGRSMGGGERERVSPYLVRTRGKGIYVYAKDYGVVQTVVAEYENKRDSNKQLRRRMARFHKSLIWSVLCSPGYEALNTRQTPFVVADYYALHVASTRGFDALAYTTKPVTQYDELTFSSARAVVNEALKVRRYMDHIASHLERIRAPATIHNVGMRSKFGFTPDQIIKCCDFDLAAIVTPGAELAIMGRAAARKYVETHFVTHFLDADPSTTPALYPWLTKPLAVGEMWFDRPVKPVCSASAGPSPGGLCAQQFAFLQVRPSPHVGATHPC
jgi:hypothetical protein